MAALKINGKTILENPELIILDKDGTLIDVHFYWTSIIRLRSERMAQTYFLGSKAQADAAILLAEAMGSDTKKNRMKHDGPVGIKPRNFIVQVVMTALKDLGVAAEAADIEQHFREIDKRTTGHVGDFVKILPGVKDFLIQANVAGVKLALGTSDRTDRAIETLNQLGVLNLFAAVIGGDKLTQHKPEPETIYQLVKETQVNLNKTMMVGDHPVDVEMANRAGLPCSIGVLTGLGTAADFLKMSHCHLAETFNDMQVA